jgi:hypothetical protein
MMKLILNIFRKSILLLILVLCTKFSLAQTVSFGFEFMQRNNKLGGVNDEAKKPDFFIKDEWNDTLGCVFNKYTITKSSFELPLYMRLKLKKRWYVDLNYSSSKYAIKLDGIANKSDDYYKSWNFTFEQFQAMAQNNSGQPATQQQYQDYISTFKTKEEQAIVYNEEFKLNSFGAIVGYTFLPHKTIKPFIFSGVSFRSKSRQYSYQFAQIKAKNEAETWSRVNDQTEINTAVLQFSQRSVVLRFGAGLETYRFRGGVSFDYCPLTQTSLPYTGGQVYRTKTIHPYNKFNSFTFYVSSDLVSKELAARKKTITNSDIVQIDKLELKKSKNALGFNLSKVITSNLTSYGYNANPITFGSIKQYYTFQNSTSQTGAGDSIIYNYRLQLVSLGSITKVDWKPLVEGFYRRTILKKLEWESSLGWQNLTLDLRTKEFETVLTYNYLYELMYPEIKTYYTGVYRTKYNFLTLGQKLYFTAVDKDFVKLKISAGLSFAGFSTKLTESDAQNGINSLGITTKIDELHTGNLVADSTTFISESLDYISFEESPMTLINNFDKEVSYATAWKPKDKIRQSYKSIKLGAEAEFNRVIVGLNYEKSIGYVDGLLIKNFSRVSFSVGYFLFRK